MATREPRPNGTSASASGPASTCVGHVAVRSLKRGRSVGGSAGASLTDSTRMSDGWRSLRRGGRIGPETSSPERSSQRRICAGETYTSSRDWRYGSARRKPLPFGSTSRMPLRGSPSSSEAAALSRGTSGSPSPSTSSG
jgi:hypothetical protein